MPSSHADPPDPNAQRRRWMGVLARAPLAELERCWAELDPQPGFRWVRPAELGLLMTRARIGGDGRRFNFGEVSVARAAVQIDGGALGHGYVAGRSRRHAELAALFDGLLQDPQRQPGLLAALIDPLAAAQGAELDRIAARAAETRVDFLTLVRGRT